MAARALVDATDCGHRVSMVADEHHPWTALADDSLVERLIHAVQRAIAREIGGEDQTGQVALPMPEVATALLNLLASVLAPAPACATARGLRLVSEAAGKELHVPMRGFRLLSTPPGDGSTH